MKKVANVTHLTQKELESGEWYNEVCKTPPRKLELCISVRDQHWSPTVPEKKGYYWAVLRHAQEPKKTYLALVRLEFYFSRERPNVLHSGSGADKGCAPPGERDNRIIAWSERLPEPDMPDLGVVLGKEEE